MTDAWATQLIQRWNTQLVAAEYLGGHVDRQNASPADSSGQNDRSHGRPDVVQAT